MTKGLACVHIQSYKTVTITGIKLTKLKTTWNNDILPVVVCEGLLFVLLCANRPRLDVPEGRLPPTKPVSLQSPSEGKEECGSERDRPAGECSTQDRE